jgi:ATP-dependent helicase HrpB
MAFSPSTTTCSTQHHHYHHYSSHHRKSNIRSRIITSLHSSQSSSQTTLLDYINTIHLQDLPINDILNSVKESIQTKPNLLLEAAPGAGKTTIIPLLVASSNDDDTNETTRTFRNNKVIVVEPRRVATRSAAQRMSSLLQQPVGQSIGYAIRGESQQSSKTQVLVMTDGVLLNMLQNDPELRGYDTVILDEFHERGVNGDVALALLREVQMNYRPDLKIIVMSATLLGSVNDGEMDDDDDDDSSNESVGTKLLRVLGGKEQCNILRSDGRQYPVTIKYAADDRTGPFLSVLRRDTKLLVKTMADAIEDGLSGAPNRGDILAFLPGVKEIRRVVEEVKSRSAFRDVDVFPLYGTLPKSDQDDAIYKGTSARRRVIVSSPIAEASLTIDGVTCVIDSGLQRQPKYDVNTGLPHLITVSCSKDSVIQRAGRAGRQSEGYCIRLFSETDFNKMQQHAVPEILSTDLVPTVLLLSEWGCTSANEILNEMSFVDSPPEDALKRAYNMLVDLGALEDYKLPNTRKRRYRVTNHGQEVVRMATHPRFASAIIRAGGKKAQLVCAVTAAALMDGDELSRKGRETNLSISIRNILKDGPSSFVGKRLLNFASRINQDARSAVFNALESSDIDIDEVTTGTALLPGFIDLIAKRKGDASYGGSRYELSMGQSARLDDRRDASEYILVIDTTTGDDGKTRVRSYVDIEPSTLRDVSSEVDEVCIVESKGYEVRARKTTKVGSLVLSSLPLPSPSAEQVTELLLNTIDDIGVTALLSMQSKKNLEEITELRQRIRIADELSDMEWPPCFSSLTAIEKGEKTAEDDGIMTSLLEPWLAGAGSLKSLDVLSILSTQLNAEQQKYIDTYFSTKIESPDGSFIPITYSENGPVASAKLQQFFGCTESPKVGEPGKSIPVTLSLLSPAGKELAKTIDLPFFWQEVYPSVRAEMRGRYPKHPWPEDPNNATATRLTKKQQQAQMPDGDNQTVVDKRKEKSKRRKTKK